MQTFDESLCLFYHKIWKFQKRIQNQYQVEIVAIETPNTHPYIDFAWFVFALHWQVDLFPD